MSSASFTSSVIRKLSKIVPDFTWDKQEQMSHWSLSIATAITLLFKNDLFLSHLPQIKTQNTNVVKLVDIWIRTVFRIVDLRMHPGSFVVGVVDLFGFPFSLQYRRYLSGCKGIGRVNVEAEEITHSISSSHDYPTLYSGLGIIGGSHSPSISSSQSSGFLASGSGMFSGLSQS